MGEAHKLTRAQLKALEAVETGDASRLRSVRSSIHDKWLGIRADVAQRLIADGLVTLPPSAGYSYGAHRLRATPAGRAALAHHRGETP